jgi:hypothetical protein
MPIPYIAECTEEEFRYIDPLFNISTVAHNRHRNLRRSAKSSAMVQEQELEHRELRSYPGKCKDYCAGMAKGTCRASGCVGYRRNLQSGNHLTCDEQLDQINNALDALMVANDGKLLSATCQRFIRKAARQSICLDDVVYGEITGFTFFTTTREFVGSILPPLTTNLMENAPNGYSICNNIPFNIEISVNPCVNMVNLTLTNSNNNFFHTRIDNSQPMTVFENATTTSGSGIYRAKYRYGVRFLEPGSYTLRAQPDNFQYKEKTLDFTVSKCT